MRLRKLVLALVVSAVGLMSFAAAANAEVPDPQTTNVPYVAWAGESVRVAKCFGAGQEQNGDAQAALQGAGFDLHSIITRGLFNIEDWSGDPQQKPVFTNAPTGDVVPTLERFGHDKEGYYRLCYSVNMTSQKAGMAVVKLSVRPDLLGLFPGLQVAAQHQFLVIWLKSQAPVIHEVGDKEPGGWSIHDDGGNPTALFQPPFEDGLTKANGLVKINVKGTFPLGNNFANTVAGDTITLPDQWDTLARLYAIDWTTNVPGRAYMRWDIHDSSNGLGLPGSDLGHALGYPLPFSNIFDAGADEHHVNSFCKASENLATDAVDNCIGIGLRYTDAQLDADAEIASWSDVGPFSNIYGGHVAMGPFDPLRPFTSLFSDGLLNAGDAPMPALQIDVALGDGSIGALGCSYDHTYSGYCTDSESGRYNKRADKDDIYVQDHTVRDWYPHNLYAPFYKQLIPPVGIAGWQDPHAALAFEEYYEGRSGVVGSFANNYPGFLGEGIYDNWEAMATAGRDGYNACKDPLGNLYPTPTGASAVSVYTDEHGEAYVRFYPYRGLDLTPDGNNRCDLSPGVYGSATIQAESIYPDQPVLWDRSNKKSNVLTKNANHLASKILRCVPKGVNEAFCVETILDFNGDPISGAQVKFTTSGDAANMDVDSVEWGGFDTRGQGVDVNPDTVGNDYAVLRTNSEGQAGVLSPIRRTSASTSRRRTLAPSTAARSLASSGSSSSTRTRVLRAARPPAVARRLIRARHLRRATPARPAAARPLRRQHDRSGREPRRPGHPGPAAAHGRRQAGRAEQVGREALLREGASDQGRSLPGRERQGQQGSEEGQDPLHDHGQERQGAQDHRPHRADEQGVQDRQLQARKDGRVRPRKPARGVTERTT